MKRIPALLSVLVLGCAPTEPEPGCVYAELRQAIEVPSIPDVALPGTCLSRAGIEATDCVVTEHDPSGTCAERAGRESVPGDPTRCRVLPGPDGFWIESDPEACGETPSDDATLMRFASFTPGGRIHVACRLPDETGCAASRDPTVDDDPTYWAHGETPPRVGSTCAPPHDGDYDDREVYVEPRSPACGGLVCMAHGLQGHSDEAELENQVFCTCRCSRLHGDPSVPLCRCPHGTQCVDEVLSVEGTSLRGGYCLPCVAPGGGGTFWSPRCE